MRIVVNNIAASQTGALTILKSFYDYVAEHEKEHEWIFLLGAPYVEELPHVRVRVLSDVKKNWLNRLKFDMISGSGYIEALKPDVVFSMQNTLTFGLRARQVLYVHQPLGFQNARRFSFFKASEREYAVYQHLIAPLIDASIRRADFTIVQTGWMRDAILKKDRILPEKIKAVMPDFPEPPVDFARDVGAEPDPKRFFFPSGDILYKNHDCIVRACRILNQKGIYDFNVLFTLKGLGSVTDLDYDNSHDNITCREKLPRREVFENYERRVLIFPSYIETLGLPLLEARSVNGLILASDCPFSHEILDGYENTYFFPPFDAVKLAEYMEKVMDGRIRRKETGGEPRREPRAAGDKAAGAGYEAGWQESQSPEDEKERAGSGTAARSAWARVTEILTCR